MVCRVMSRHTSHLADAGEAGEFSHGSVEELADDRFRGRRRRVLPSFDRLRPPRHVPTSPKGTQAYSQRRPPPWRELAPQTLIAAPHARKHDREDRNLAD